MVKKENCYIFKLRSHRKGLMCILLCICMLLISGCGTETVISDAYEAYSGNVYQTGSVTDTLTTFTDSLCVTADVNYGTDQTTSSVAEGAGVFNVTEGEVTYSQNLFEQLYPASTTKILTAYIILKNGCLTDTVTVSENAADQDSDSSICGINAGDVITVEDLLYGLMLASGNDAAIALAEYYSGSVDAFADEMNAVAQSLGATNSHFVNPNGLPDEDHYTTVYDMYLIFAEAISLDSFVTIISSTSYDATYTDADGETVEKTWSNTNKYLTGEEDAPEGITVIGGKTGTTNAAGYCLVLYSVNSDGDDIISIVFKADGRSDLYLLMGQMLEEFGG